VPAAVPSVRHSFSPIPSFAVNSTVVPTRAGPYQHLHQHRPRGHCPPGPPRPAARGAEGRCGRVPVCPVWFDGLGSPIMVEEVEACGGEVVILTQQNQKEQREVDPHVYLERNVAERFWARIK
jgi:hypothetical protein